MLLCLKRIRDLRVSDQVSSYAFFALFASEEDGEIAGGNAYQPEIIVPASIAVPDTPDPESGKRPPRRPRRALMAAISLAIVVGLFLIYSLARRNDIQTEKSEPASLPSDATPASDSPSATASIDSPDSGEERPEPIDPGKLLLDRERAEESLSAFLSKKGMLDQKGVLEWGSTIYADVLRVSAQADQMFLTQDFEAAINAYNRAMRDCEVLIAQIPEAFTNLLIDGSNALNAARGALAQRKFSAALKIDPTNALARVGLTRSKTIDRVVSLMASGNALEQQGKVALALTDYLEASRLDPMHELAAAAAKRAGDAIKQSEFQKLMSEGLRALETGDLIVSQQKFLKAGRFYPESKEVQDALLQVEEKRRLITIRQLSEKAAEAEKQEDWTEAYARYREILKIDPHIRVATEGSERSAKRIRLGKQIQYYLNHPDSLQSEQGREKATLTLYEAKALEDTGKQWTDQLSRFEDAVILATTPVRAVLESDGVTHVDVYQVGRFGPFHSKELSLLPGSYTVVGHRKGYKDVRITLKVAPGAEHVHQSIICLDRI